MSRIEILPAIDVIGGKCVRLTKGDYAKTKVYDYSPLEMAKRYADCGVKRIHMVDLDGAKQSSPANLKTLEQVASGIGIEIEWGGGVSSGQALRDVFNAGATHAIVGSVAALHPELFKAWMVEFGTARMILGADVRNGAVAVKGWQESTELTIEDLVGEFLPLGLQEMVCTDISRDGMLQGPSTELYVKLKETFPELSTTVSGGISCWEDIERLDALDLRKVIVGKAIYENRISLSDIEKWSLNA